MRMWMTDPQFFCRKHLLGSFKKKIRIDGYINNNLLEPLSIQSYHDRCVEEMEKRGYNHKTPLKIEEGLFDYFSEEHLNHKVNLIESMSELLRRCPECRFKRRTTRT